MNPKQVHRCENERLGCDDEEVFLEADSPKEEIRERMKDLQLGFDRMKLKKKKASKYAKESIPKVIVMPLRKFRSGNFLTATVLIHERREALGSSVVHGLP